MTRGWILPADRGLHGQVQRERTRGQAGAMAGADAAQQQLVLLCLSLRSSSQAGPARMAVPRDIEASVYCVVSTHKSHMLEILRASSITA